MAKDEFQSGSVFWILAFLISIVGVIYISIWSYHNNSIKGLAVAIIFFMMLVGSAVVSRNVLFNSSTWSQNALSFSLGFLAWLFIGANSSKSVVFSSLSAGTNSLFASVASELPIFLEFIMNSFVIPIAEESLWIIAIPDVTKWIMNKVGDNTRFSIISNKWVQLVTIIIIASVSFALFHVGKLFTAFIVSAVIFRTILIIFVVGDEEDINLIPKLQIVAAFAVGAHVGANWGDFGFGQGISLLLNNPGVGLPVLILLGILLLTGIGQIMNLVYDMFGGRTSA